MPGRRTQVHGRRTQVHGRRTQVGRTLLMALVAIAVMGGSTAALNGELAPGGPDRAEAMTQVSPASAGRAGSFRIAYSDPDQAVREAARHRVFILNADAYDRIPAIKAANPAAVVLVYKDLSSARTDSYSYRAATRSDNTRLPTGVGYGDADRNHPEWFLTGPDGRRLEWGGYANHWQMDVGNAAYQQAWANNVEAEAVRDGWDGVFIDNVNWKNTAYNNPGPTRYAAPGAMQAATRSMLARVGPQLRGAGLTTIANIAEARLVPGLWADWLSFVDGAMEEHFTNWSSATGGPFVHDWGTDGWRAMLDQVATADRLDKIAVLRIGGAEGDVEAMRYGLATYLLANDGRSVIASPEFQAPPSYPELTWDLGAPAGPFRALGNGAYRRDFARGVVVVNASDTRTHTEALGASYLDHAGRTVTSITLGTTRAAVLRATGATPSAPPAAAPVVAPNPAGPASSAAPAPAPALTNKRYWVATRNGRVLGFPEPYSAAAAPTSIDGVVGLAATTSGAGTWVVSGDGRLATTGDAAALGSLAGRRLNLPIVGIDATSGGTGYWMVASDGGIFSFGDARFYGSTGGRRLNKPIVGMTSTPSGAGYWLLASDGGIFSFGDARFYGSTGGRRLNKPIVAMASTPSGAGYWLVASDGGIFSFGDARFYGSTGGQALNSPIVGMATSDTGNGYRLVAADGGVFTFGDATFAGSAVGTDAPVVAVAG